MKAKNYRFLSAIGSLIPLRFRVAFIRRLIWAQITQMDPASFFGILVIISILIGIAGGVFIFEYTGSIFFSILAFVGLVLLVLVLTESMLTILADRVSSEIEKFLPDMLMLMAANLRAGMVPENSFLATIKPAFGKLNVLLKEAAIEVQGGKDFKSALIEMADKTSSTFFRSAIKIIGDSLRAGGELDLVLENLANNIMQNEALRASMRAQVRSYSLFIFIASVIAGPLLYGVSSMLIDIMNTIGSTISTSSTSTPTTGLGIFASFSLPHIPANVVFFIALLNVIITATASSILGGELNEGKVLSGLKYVPVYILIGLFVFLGAREFMGSILNSSVISGGPSISSAP
ncbi:MAG: type II secretion system F family protein [Candidatus Acidifodinimicrobium sp.]